MRFSLSQGDLNFMGEDDTIDTATSCVFAVRSFEKGERIMKARFYICRHCGNLIGMIHDSGVPIVCCGEEMEALIPNTVDASGEKHLPVAVMEEGGILSVNVGSAEHPMLPQHWIQWIYVQTENGGQRKILHPGDKPCANFCIGDDKPVAVYAYCNLHGLWVTEL